MCDRRQHTLSALNSSLVNATIALNVKAICITEVEPEDRP